MSNYFQKGFEKTAVNLLKTVSKGVKTLGKSIPKNGQQYGKLNNYTKDIGAWQRDTASKLGRNKPKWYDNLDSGSSKTIKPVADKAVKPIKQNLSLNSASDYRKADSNIFRPTKPKKGGAV